MQTNGTNPNILNPAFPTNLQNPVGHQNPQGFSTPTHNPPQETTHMMPTQSTMVFGGVGGTGTTTLIKHLQANGIQAFEPHCFCSTQELLSNPALQAPQTKVVVVPATSHGAEAASLLTAQYRIQIVAVIQTTPLTLPFAARTKFRAITGRTDTTLFPHVWAWKKGQTNKPSKQYSNAIKELRETIQKHFQLERNGINK